MPKSFVTQQYAPPPPSTFSRKIDRVFQEPMQFMYHVASKHSRNGGKAKHRKHTRQKKAK